MPTVVVAAVFGIVAVPTAASAAACAPVSVDARVLLSGPYDAQTGLMGDALRTTGILPSTEPYSGLGFAMRGGEGNTAQLGDPATSDASSIVDWVLFELRDAADPSAIVATDAVTVERDGDLSRPLSFAVPSGEYYLAVEHRNHLGVMTATPIALSAGTPVSVDFTDPATPVWNRTDIDGGSGPIDYRGSERDLQGGVAMLWMGDADDNGRVVFDGVVDDDPAAIEATVIGAPDNALSSASYVYRAYVGGDLNMDADAIFQGQRNDSDVAFNAVTRFPLNNANDASYAYMYEQLPPSVLGEDLSATCEDETPPTDPPADPVSDPAAPPAADDVRTLAETGADASTTPLAITGAALLALGGMSLVIARRRTAER